MKYLPSQLAYLIAGGESRANLRALGRYLFFLAALVTVYTVLFHIIMETVEGQDHSWLTGLYWTLVVMTTLGFGDVTFATDLGRAFSIVVLLSGVVFLLVLLPFLFVRLFYAPWLEARIRFRAPREVPATTTGHVILTDFDPIAEALVERLRSDAIPYFVLEPDPTRAAQLADRGISVVTAEREGRDTYERTRANHAKLIVANGDDRTDANVALTVRETAPTVPVVAIVEDEEAVEILEVAGATSVLPLKRRLGEALANRAYTSQGGAHVIGSVHGVQIAEIPARDTDMVGQTVRSARLRERTGLNIIGLWQQGTLLPAYATSVIDPKAVLVLAGTTEQLAALNALLPERNPSGQPLVLVIGAGLVGISAARCLRQDGVRVHVVDRQDVLTHSMSAVADKVVIGNAASREVLSQAGLEDAASVLLTTNDDATNIYLALFCRKLRPNLRVVSRITHERNVEAIHRAGADFALSYTSLGVNALLSLLHEHESVLVGEGVELFSIRVPKSLEHSTLHQSLIGSKTAMSVVAVRDGDRVEMHLDGATVLPPGADLLVLGTLPQRNMFAREFERA